MLYRLIRPLLFRLTRDDPERAHHLAITLLQACGHIPGFRAAAGAWLSPREPRLARELWGIRFPGPVGLAAGFDKDGVAAPALAALGFGFLELGTVTPRPQPGNPRPRLFRLPASQAVINRMGFNNAGAGPLAARLRRVWPLPVPVGISLGRNKDTPDAQAAEDYCTALRLVYPCLDYFAVNISSPNTPGLRRLQDRTALDQLLARLQDTARQLAGDATPPPLLVKIAPDLEPDPLLDLLEVCRERRVAGIIATNTTLARDGIQAPEQALGGQAGGLSGRPLTVLARERVAFIHRETGGRLPIIGVGGILEPDDALRLLDAGASLVQVYTGLVYQGIGLLQAIHRSLLAR
jgi:dihydroorotate dehydrogenase